jgi:hypothetical protein
MLKKYRPNDTEPEHSSVEIPTNGRGNGRAATVSEEEDEEQGERYERGKLRYHSA